MKNRYTLIFISLMMVVALTSCGKKEIAQEILRPVRYEQVHLNGSNLQRAFSGTASAGANSDLSFKVNGTLIKRAVNVGDRVKKGDLIAELDPTDYKIQAQEMQASYAQAEAKVRNSKANYDRTKSLYENDSVSKSDLDAARATYDSDKAALAALKQKSDLAKVKVGYTKLLAPMDGVIGDIQVEENENVKADEMIMNIESEGDIKVVVGVPESYISRINTETKATVKFSSLGSKSLQAQVTEVAYSRAGASTYPVTVVLADASADVRPGMTAEVIFSFSNGGKQGKNIIVSASSVAEDTKGKFVFILKNQGEGVGTVHRRDIEVNGLTNQGFEIKSGLDDGELVVTAGVSKLSDGMKVKFN